MASGAVEERLPSSSKDFSGNILKVLVMGKLAAAKEGTACNMYIHSVRHSKRRSMKPLSYLNQ